MDTNDDFNFPFFPLPSQEKELEEQGWCACDGRPVLHVLYGIHCRKQPPPRTQSVPTVSPGGCPHCHK